MNYNSRVCRSSKLAWLNGRASDYDSVLLNQEVASSTLAVGLFFSFFAVFINVFENLVLGANPGHGIVFG